MTTRDLDEWARAIREHERELRRLGGNSRCAPGCPHERAPEFEAVRAALGEAVAADWEVFVTGSGPWMTERGD